MTEIKDDKLQKDKMTLIIFAEMMQVQYDKIVEQNKSLQQELRKKTAQCEELKKVLDEIEGFCYVPKTDRTSLEILDIIKRTGGQRVKAERTRLMPAVQDKKQRKVKNE